MPFLGAVLVIIVLGVLVTMFKLMFKTGFFGENIINPPKRRRW
jgi:hypothetical protein